jgi:hypothetical protein
MAFEQLMAEAAAKKETKKDKKEAHKKDAKDKEKKHGHEHYNHPGLG